MFTKQQNLDSSKLKDFADDNLMLKMAEASPKGLKTLWEKEKLLVSSNFTFPTVFKRLVLQTCKNRSLFGEG